MVNYTFFLSFFSLIANYQKGLCNCLLTYNGSTAATYPVLAKLPQTDIIPSETFLSRMLKLPKRHSIEKSLKIIIAIGLSHFHINNTCKLK